MTTPLHRAINTALAVLLAMVFFASALAKVVGAKEFRTFVASLPLLSLLSPNLLLILVIIAEMVVAFLLLIPRMRTLGGVSSIVVLTLFTSTLVYSSLRGEDQSCGCFGEMAELSPEVSILRNVFLIAFSAYVAGGDRFSQLHELKESSDEQNKTISYL